MSVYQPNMSEESYKQALYQAYFKNYKYEPDYGKSRIDFVISDPKDVTRHLLWAEVKNEKTAPLDMLTQLILTVKKTFFGAPQTQISADRDFI